MLNVILRNLTAKNIYQNWKMLINERFEKTAVKTFVEDFKDTWSTEYQPFTKLSIDTVAEIQVRD